MRRGLPERSAGQHQGRGACRRDRRHHRLRARRRRPGNLPAMGDILHAERRLHRGVRRGRQSALSPGHGARRDQATRFRAGPATPRRLDEISRHQPGGDDAVAATARTCGAGTARPRGGLGTRVGRGAGLHLLHRLQRAEDATYRAAGARYHGYAGDQLSVHGRPQPLLRRRAASHRRRRNVRPNGHQLDRQDVATANRDRCCRGVRAARSSSPRRPCRPSSGNAARGRSR